MELFTQGGVVKKIVNERQSEKLFYFILLLHGQLVMNGLMVIFSYLTVTPRDFVPG